MTGARDSNIPVVCRVQDLSRRLQLSQPCQRCNLLVPEPPGCNERVWPVRGKQGVSISAAVSRIGWVSTSHTESVLLYFR